MRKIIKENFELFKVAPLRSFLAFILLIPGPLAAVAVMITLGGMTIELLSNFLLFGLSGLDHKFEWEFYKIPARFCWNIFEFLIPFGNIPFKMFLAIPYLLVAILLLGSAHRRLEMKKESNFFHNQKKRLSARRFLKWSQGESDPLIQASTMDCRTNGGPLNSTEI